MSCEIKHVAKLPDLKKVQELLGFSQDESWLNAIYLSVSPLGDVITFGHGSKLVILSSHCQSGSDILTYTISWTGEMENPNDIITALQCISMGSGGSGTEWTCLFVGFASGTVMFYTEFGTKLLSQKWHSEPIQFIKAQSGRSVPEEIYIGYISCICIFGSHQIVPILNSLRAKNISCNSNKPDEYQLTDDSIPCRKWEYRNSKGTINDSVVVGSIKSCAYDHLVEQCLEGGIHGKYRNVPAQNSLVLTVGTNPYIGFYYAKEGFVQTDFGDVAKAVASRVMSSLPGWLFKSSSSQKSQETHTNIPSEPMFCRFGICDMKRQGLNIWLSQDNTLAAVTDNLNRIVLIDCNNSITIRMWKGYRDAQCAFIKVTEKTSRLSKENSRNAHFLVIYAPRQSVLEIWALQSGPKVAAFNASKNGQLIYIKHGVMGVKSGCKIKFTTNSCLFVDPSDETLKEINVPFHCAVSNGDTKTAKDIHLLRRLKICLRSNLEFKEMLSEVQVICSKFETAEIKLHCLTSLMKMKKINPLILKEIIDGLKINMEDHLLSKNTSDVTGSDSENLFHETDSKSLPTILESYLNLVNFYIDISQSTNCLDGHIEKSLKLSLSEADINTIQMLFDLFSNDQPNHRVKFQENEEEEDFIEFRNAFIIDSKHVYLDRDKVDLFSNIGELLFRRFFKNVNNSEGFIKAAEKSTIDADDFLKLLLHYWLKMQFSYTKIEEIFEDMNRLSIIIHSICKLAQSRIEYEYNEICPWWQNVREILLESPCALRGFLSAIVCRNLCHQLRKIENTDEDEDVWEQVSQEAAQWSLLIGKLEDISVLGTIVSVTISSAEEKFPIITFEKPQSSLKTILTGGKGIVAELVAKWLINCGINPKDIIENSKCPENDNIKNSVLQRLHILRQHFPFSLASGVVLCQMAWEYMSHWSKNLGELEFLKAGISCLEAFQEEDFALKHGLCCMIWNAHLKIPVEATKKLINKSGRLPKEKFCQQDVGMSDVVLAEFLEYCIGFFCNFSSSLYFGKRELKFEEILQEGQIPLSFLTLQRNHAIPDLLNLHTELCMVLYLIASLGLKIPRPILFLFDAVSNEVFFVEINRELNYSLPAADIVLQKNRQEFLCQAVAASVDLIREDLEQLYVVEHNIYMEHIFKLATIWKLEFVPIKNCQVIQLYAHGWDVYAEEILEKLVDKYDLGPMLLEIACRRLNVLIEHSSKLWALIATTGSLLIDYLDDLKTDHEGQQIGQNADELNLDNITKLANKSFEILSKKISKQLRIAGQLLHACQIIKESNLVQA